MLMSEIVAMAKVSQQNQITIPKDVRKILEVEAGDKVLFIEHGNSITIQKKVELR